MSEIVTAGILVIGDEILSGRTKDKNIGFIAEYLTNIGIDLKEVRVVADEEDDIIAALNALRDRYDYVFTTGGIGPTHDDITADSVAKAFGVPINHHPDVVERFKQAVWRRPQRGAAAHGAGAGRRVAGRERDHHGAGLLDRQRHHHGRRAEHHAGDDGHRRAEAAVGPADAVGERQGQRARGRHRRTVARRSRSTHPDTVIGSYPFLDDEKKPNTNLVVRSRDPEKLRAAMDAVQAMLAHAQGDALAGDDHDAAGHARRSGSDLPASRGDVSRLECAGTERRHPADDDGAFRVWVAPRLNDGSYFGYIAEEAG